MILFQILLILVAFLLIGILLSPLESLSWWSRSGAEDIQRMLDTSRQLAIDDFADESKAEADHYLVYLSGIGIISGDSLPPIEISMVQAIIDRVGKTKVIYDVYPYSPSNSGLTSNRPMSWLWRFLWRLKGTRASTIAFTINIRNAIQLMVSMDSRYGPVYNLGVAHSIWQSLLRQGYQPAHRKPVTLLGWSGGGQIAVAVAWYLAAMGVPVYVLSVGGIVSSDAGLDRVEHMWHLTGSKDKVQRNSQIIFAGRWKTSYKSYWNKAMREGKIDLIDIGPLAHTGKEGYFSTEPLTEDGTTPFGLTIDKIVSTLVDAGLAKDLGEPNQRYAPPAQREIHPRT